MNKALLELIVFYCDGVGEFQMQFIIEIEIPEVKRTFKRFGENYNPQFAKIT